MCVTDLEITLARHDERIRGLEEDFCAMKATLAKIQHSLLTLTGGMVVSLLLLVLNLVARR